MYIMNFWKMIIAGGPLMWPIIACSIFGLGLIIDKFNSLQRIDKGSGAFLKDVFNHVRRHEIKEALDKCERASLPVAQILKAALLKYDRPRTQIKEAIEDAALYEIPLIEKNLSLLATIAYVVPLLGFLGTVGGMVSCFQAAELRMAAAEPVLVVDLAAGIWRALIATIAGLTVAIPVLVAHNYFVSRINMIVLEMERVSTEFLNLLTE
jgi:biopolymer transport protein ExbB